jgi:signal transduction histidine kinase
MSDGSVTMTPASTGISSPERDPAPAGSPQGIVRAAVRRFLSTPLVKKLIVADLVINITALVVVQRAPQETSTEILVGAFLVTLALNGLLVYWALLPLRTLEETARRVSKGNLGARFAAPAMGDRNIARIGATFNDLLDGLTADRARVRYLASQVISAGDAERAHIARELHDSTAQALTALEMILSSALRDPEHGATAERIRMMRDITTQALGEVRTLSHNVHPRVLDDLGLVAALEHLARRTREQSHLAVWVASDERETTPAPVASVLYRVAQSALNNAVRHARGTEVHVTIRTDREKASMEIVDNGVGFDVDAVERGRNGMGLFIMRERLGLVSGVLTVTSALGRGTVVRATVPLREE